MALCQLIHSRCGCGTSTNGAAPRQRSKIKWCISLFRTELAGQPAAAEAQWSQPPNEFCFVFFVFFYSSAAAAVHFHYRVLH